MSKSPTQVGTNTTTTTSAPPPYIAEAQQNLMNAAGSLTLPFVQGGPPANPVAGFTPDQEMGFSLARDAAQNANNPNNYLNNTQFAPWNLAQWYQNPYQRDVVGTTTQQLTEANDKQLAAIRARQAAEGSYGGNRGALEEMEQNRNFGNTLAQTTAGLNQAGWQNSQQLGMQDAQKNIALQGQQWQQQMQALQALLSGGATQQQLAQQAISVPYQMLDIFRGVVPNSFGTSSTNNQPIYGQSPLNTALSLGTMAAGAFGASSRKLKTDIQKIGKDEDTGLNMYAYRYKGDPKNTVKVVGPMAEDIEKRFPGSTAEIDGIPVVKPHAARALLGL